MTVAVELTAGGDLRMSAAVAERFFPNGVLVPLRRGPELWLLPTRGAAAGGLLLKQRNAAGDRSVLVRESLGEEFSPGPREAAWDESQGALRVLLEALP
ncbi:hydrogenase maturation protease [Frigoriglobus tundricola]|uniref:Hydrogenase maturation protease n=1 Tax=Frigoriglobus tundricola TaxID=2774151 RepID=A0A6M5YN22_9BACT|nr:hydrogenase maturation protease [Frigoriglobus tundricola]QJW94964.1 Hydrogenase maturation protease [Frigoriglobus tundricola]